MENKKKNGKSRAQEEKEPELGDRRRKEREERSKQEEGERADRENIKTEGENPGRKRRISSSKEEKGIHECRRVRLGKGES